MARSLTSGAAGVICATSGWAVAICLVGQPLSVQRLRPKALGARIAPIRYRSVYERRPWARTAYFAALAD